MSSKADFLKGAWDLHVHADPSLFPRWGDALELAKVCQKANMAGFVLKFHHGSSVEVARILNKQFDSLNILGGLTLNGFVGGLNPLAVEAAIQLGAKLIWLPTIHSAEHELKCGCLGGFDFLKDTPIKKTQSPRLSIVDDKRDLLPKTKDIVDLLNGSATVLATGHISASEIKSLKTYIDQNNLDIRLLINHVFFKTPRLTSSQISDLAGPNVWFEVVHLSSSPLVHCTSLDEVAKVISENSKCQWVLASDSGQTQGVQSPVALSELATGLIDRGLDKNTIQNFLTHAPKQLLSI